MQTGDSAPVRHSSLPELSRPISARRGSTAAHGLHTPIVFPSLVSSFQQDTDSNLVYGKQRSPSADAINVSFDHDFPTAPVFRRSASAGGRITPIEPPHRSSRSTPRRLDPLQEPEPTTESELRPPPSVGKSLVPSLKISPTSVMSESVRAVVYSDYQPLPLTARAFPSAELMTDDATGASNGGLTALERLRQERQRLRLRLEQAQTLLRDDIAMLSARPTSAMSTSRATATATTAHHQQQPSDASLQRPL